MRKRILAAAIAFVAILGTGIGSAYAAGILSSNGTTDYCVTFGHGITAAGNVVEYNWAHVACPTGTYPHSVADNDTMPTTSPSPSESATGAPTDNDSSLPYLPENFNVNGVGGSPPITSFTITDNGTNPVTVWTCQFTIPTSNPGAPGITCKH